MTAQIAAYGRLVADPQLKTTSKGTQMAMASMAIPLPCSQADDGTATMWLSILAFGRQADALAKHHKGELVSVAGNMQVSQWTGQNGETRQGWQVIADSVISARTARPGGKKGQQGQATDALNRAKQQTGQHDDPVLAWSMSNVVMQSDANANIKPNKKKSSNKIDPSVAALMAFGTFQAEHEEFAFDMSDSQKERLAAFDGV
ncbi:TPA: single-stranded DNA-binding protein [Escherichia coli]|nr:single-stranded DNA-binding protein [Escherichia coli]